MHRPEDRAAPPIGQRSLPVDDLAAAEQLVALSHDLMGAVDAGRRLVWTNPAWKALLGWEPEELAGVVYSDLLHPADREPAAAAALDRCQLDPATAGVLERVARDLGDRGGDVLRLDPRQPAALCLLARRARRGGDVRVAGHAHRPARAHPPGR